jgi:hypothetical protein
MSIYQRLSRAHRGGGGEFGQVTALAGRQSLWPRARAKIPRQHRGESFHPRASHTTNLNVTVITQSLTCGLDCAAASIAPSPGGLVPEDARAGLGEGKATSAYLNGKLPIVTTKIMPT